MPFLERHIDFGPPRRISSWRKIALGTWRTAKDPSVYGFLDVDAAAALAYLEKAREKTGARVTLTHFAGRALAETLRRHPELNAVLRLGRLYPRKSVDIFYQVASDSEGRDLSGMVVREADSKSLSEIAREVSGRVRSIRDDTDTTFKKMKGIMAAIPGILIGCILDLTGFLLYTLNLWSPALGTPRDPFGSAMITSIGTLGLDMGFAPLVPYSRVPLVLALGAARDEAVVRDGKIVVMRRVRLCATFDHRLIDGVHASKMARTMTGIFLDPVKELGEPS